jgi:two-component system LytT family response regulator
LPQEPAAPLKPATGPSLAPFKWVASPKPGNLLGGFCPDPGAEERIAVNSNGLMLFLRLDDVEWVQANDDGVELHVGQQTHPVRSTLAAMAAKLPSNRFLRLSPWTLVNIKQIKELRANLQGEYEVRLRNGQRLALIRRHSSNVRPISPFLPRLWLA